MSLAMQYLEQLLQNEFHRAPGTNLGIRKSIKHKLKVPRHQQGIALSHNDN